MPLFSQNFTPERDNELSNLLPHRLTSYYPNDEFGIISKRDDFTLIGPKNRQDRMAFFVLYRNNPIAMVGTINGNPYPRVTMSYVKPPFRSMGLGFELYRTIVDRFGGLTSDSSLSPDGKRLWDKFSRMQGYMVADQDGQYDNHTPEWDNPFTVKKLNEDRYHDGKKFYRELSPHSDENIYQNPKWQPEIPHWPLSDMELRNIEKQIFQQPAWLHYYARFDWTSWSTLEGNWWFNKHKNEFSFYDVPALSYYHGVPTPDRVMVVMQPDGTIKQEPNTVVLPTALRMCRDVVKAALPKMQYLKNTYYIRFGMWPKSERSQNFLIKDRVVLEKGVSVYHANYDLDDDRWAIDPSVNEESISGTMQTLIYGNRPIFLVQGTEIDEEGADGEPLLHNVKLIKQLSRDEVYCAGIFDPREDD